MVNKLLSSGFVETHYPGEIITFYTKDIQAKHTPFMEYVGTGAMRDFEVADYVHDMHRRLSHYKY